MLHAVHAGPFEAEVDGDLDGVHTVVDILVAVRAPDIVASEVDGGRVQIVHQAEIDTEADAGDHQFAEQTGVGAASHIRFKERLLPVVVVDV